MRLLNDATSPFGRKTMVAAIERGLPLVEEFVDLREPQQLAQWNPLHQIPVLVTEDGKAVYDSMAILLFLDTRHRGTPLFPEADRFATMTRAALCDGLMESVLLRVMEIRRPKNEQSPAFIAKLEGRIGHVLAELEGILGSRTPGAGPMLADDIAAACALGYVDFRYTADWRAAHPKAAAWFAACQERPSLRDTAPTRTRPATSGKPEKG